MCCPYNLGQFKGRIRVITLFRCLDADYGAECGVCVCICRANCLDLVIILGTLLRAGVGHARFCRFDQKRVILAVGRTINIVLIRARDLAPADLRLASCCRPLRPAQGSAALVLRAKSMKSASFNSLLVNVYTYDTNISKI